MVIIICNEATIGFICHINKIAVYLFVVFNNYLPDAVHQKVCQVYFNSFVQIIIHP